MWCKALLLEKVAWLECEWKNLLGSVLTIQRYHMKFISTIHSFAPLQTCSAKKALYWDRTCSIHESIRVAIRVLLLAWEARNWLVVYKTGWSHRPNTDPSILKRVINLQRKKNICMSLYQPVSIWHWQDSRKTSFFFLRKGHLCRRSGRCK